MFWYRIKNKQSEGSPSITTSHSILILLAFIESFLILIKPIDSIAYKFTQLSFSFHKCTIPDAILEILLFGCLLPIFVYNFGNVNFLDLGFIEPFDFVYDCTIFLLFFYKLMLNGLGLLLLKLLFDKRLIFNIPFNLLFGQHCLFGGFCQFRKRQCLKW